MSEMKFRQVCHCEKCGSEAEMMVTCEYVPEEGAPASDKTAARVLPEKTDGAVPGHAVCSHCGAEADMWVEY